MFEREARWMILRWVLIVGAGFVLVMVMPQIIRALRSN
jgi:hypothetical protein